MMSDDMEQKMQDQIEAGLARKEAYDCWLETTDVPKMLRGAADELSIFINKANKGEDPDKWFDYQTCEDVSFAAHYVQELIGTLADILEKHHMSSVDWPAMKIAERLLKKEEKKPGSIQKPTSPYLFNYKGDN